MADRKALSTTFLQAQGWADAKRDFLAGDASDRSYDRVVRGDDRAVLMDAPPGKGDEPAIFIAVAAYLQRLGLSVPQVLAQDLTHGFLLLEDLGDAVFARVLRDEPLLEPVLYGTGVDALLCLQSAPNMPGLANPTASDWATAALFALDWYRFGISADRVDAAPFHAALTDLLLRHADGPRVMIHRDYHAENLIWLPEREGLRRAGVLDFQLLQLGPQAYDLVSLLQDARRHVGAPTVTQMKLRFLQATGAASSAFEASFATIGAQRALRIIGIFARLCLISGKPHYLAMIPHVWQHLQTNLTHPALAPLRQICDTLLPTPTPANLTLLREKCQIVPAA